jgi:transcriptional regulator with XRE-family HTH domain
MSSAATFGDQLRDWRKSRARSQLDLSTLVGYSQRHLSFLESGRSNPSRVSVLALCDALQVPLRDRNRMLVAAGFAPAYPNRALDAPELDEIMSNVKALIDRQAPFPTLLVDPLWNLIHANSSALLLFADLLGEVATFPTNVLEACFDEAFLKPRIKDWERTALAFLARLRRDAANDPGDQELAALTARLEAKAGALEDIAPADSLLSPVLTITFLRGANSVEPPHEQEELQFFSLIASIGHAQDVGLSGLHVETFVPANPATRAAMEAYQLQH